MISNFDADKNKMNLIYIYLILIKILILEGCDWRLLTESVNGLILTVKLMVNNFNRANLSAPCRF